MSDHNYYCTLLFINNQNKIQINKFKINFDSPDGNELIIDKIIEDNNMEYWTGITCQLLFSSLYQKNIIICFATNFNDYLINGIIFEPENMSLLSVEYKNINIDIDFQRDTNFIRSIITYNNEILLICQEQSGYPLRCQLYDLENNIWSDYIYLGSNIIGIQSDFSFHMTNQNEYIFYYNNKYNHYKIYIIMIKISKENADINTNLFIFINLL